MTALQSERSDEGDTDKRRPSQAKALVGLIDAHEIELLHANDEAFVRAQLDNGAKALYQVHSRSMKSFLAAKYYKLTGGAARSQAMSEALDTIAARAVYDPASQKIEVSIRVSVGASEIHLDLGDDAWNEVNITAEGWEIRGHQTYFRRAPGMTALPMPQRGGSLDLLRAHTNLSGKENDGKWALVASWLVASVATSGPYALLALIAEQGSAKSTTARMLRSLVDPSVVPLIGIPREDQDLLIAANASHVLALDNLSRLDGDLSDLLCRIATDTGHRTRTLFTNTEETFLNARRPIMLTAITDVIQRGDLTDRSVTVQLRAISDEQRRDENELWENFERDRPLIFGALLDAVSLVLRKRDEVRRSITYRPRMLDYAIAAVAAEDAYGVTPGTWEEAHRFMRGNAHAAQLEHPLASAILVFLDGHPDGWSGTATQLLASLTTISTEEIRRRRDWPADAPRLASTLRRLTPSLRENGIEVNFDTRANDRSRARIICLSFASKNRKLPFLPSAPSNHAQNADSNESPPHVLPSANHALPSAIRAGTDATDSTDGKMREINQHAELTLW